MQRSEIDPDALSLLQLPSPLPRHPLLCQPQRRPKLPRLRSPPPLLPPRPRAPRRRPLLPLRPPRRPRPRRLLPRPLLLRRPMPLPRARSPRRRRLPLSRPRRRYVDCVATRLCPSSSQLFDGLVLTVPSCPGFPCLASNQQKAKK